MTSASRSGCVNTNLSSQSRNCTESWPPVDERERGRKEYCSASVKRKWNK